MPAGLAEVAIRTGYVNGTEALPVAFLKGIYAAPQYRRKGVAKSLSTLWLHGQALMDAASSRRTRCWRTVLATRLIAHWIRGNGTRGVFQEAAGVPMIPAHASSGIRPFPFDIHIAGHRVAHIIAYCVTGTYTP